MGGYKCDKCDTACGASYQDNLNGICYYNAYKYCEDCGWSKSNCQC